EGAMAADAAVSATGAEQPAEQTASPAGPTIPAVGRIRGSAGAAVTARAQQATGSAGPTILAVGRIRGSAGAAVTARAQQATGSAGPTEPACPARRGGIRESAHTAESAVTEQPPAGAAGAPNTNRQGPRLKRSLLIRPAYGPYRLYVREAGGRPLAFIFRSTS